MELGLPTPLQDLMMKLKLTIACLLLALSAAGCSFMPWSSEEVVPDPTAELLFKEGTDFFNKQKYILAIDRFQRVKTDFPFSPLVTEAELRLAETYYKHEQYPEAIAAFKEFQAMHPTNENIPFVIYHLGMAHFAQFTAIDRDQKMTEIAKSYFETVVKNHPKSPYVDEAKKKLAQCSEYLAEHEFNVAAFYMKAKNYPAARDRLEGIVSEYPDTPTAAKSIYHLGQSYQLEKNSVKASLAYEALLQYYPESPFSGEAKNNLAKLDQEKQDPLAMLLKRDGRPFYIPPPAQADGNGQITDLNKEKMPDLYAKKEVVHEEPGSEKGIFRRVADTLNPFSSSSEEKKSDPKAKRAPEKIETAKDDSDGFFGSLWSGLNPFASKEKTEVVVPKDPGLMGRVDESLKEQGVVALDGGRVPEPPASELPRIAETRQESQQPPADPAEVLEKVDSALQQQGTNTDNLPASPELPPALQAAFARREKQSGAEAKPTPEPASGELITDIDRVLRQKGLDVPEIKLTERKTDSQGSQSEESALGRAEKIDLDTNVEFEKGPLFLESGDYKVEKKAGANEKNESSEKSSESTALPEAVVTGPPQLEKKKPEEKKPRNKTELVEGEEENKSAWDQMRDDVESVSKALNPFSW